ncbi:transcriptional regulator, TraR/DksA family [Desulfuromusa kysingii]|uniref:Transcriptional regulator, TraR/DksA family n=1 Tax=Desulfuromusa kysingii TaxID=37625 RepID=A0A1H3ZWZ8_9BACT|nr:TraR/DksA C4-type zinc finger protein [Desulfuromusa kysingii]SEA28219.1 transcriptional regulator, TraR/DksA family [Desulfuromusa kysingii]
MQLERDCYQPHHEESYMNLRQKEFFRAKLVDWRERLDSERQASLQRIRTTDMSGGDVIDQSVKEHDKTMDYFTRRRTETTIAKINAALNRLKDGSYGYCLESGEEIGLKRLLAYPIATLSVEAQEFSEEHQRVHQYSIAL